MGWVRELPSGRWQGCYRDPVGRVRTKPFGPREKKAARRWVSDMEAAIRRGAYVDPTAGKKSLAKLWAEWRVDSSRLGRPAPTTLAKYEGIWRLYVEPALGLRAVASITRADVSNLVSKTSERSPWQATEVLKLLRMLLNRAMDSDLIVRNPAARPKLPRTQRRELTVLTPSDIDRLSTAVPDRWRAFILLAAYSSLRFSELAGLRQDRVNFLRRRLLVEEKIVEVAGRPVRGEPKTRLSRRAVSLPEFVIKALAEHVRKYPPAANGLIFHSDGEPIRRVTFYRQAWHPARKACDLDGYPFRNLRHTGASLAIAAGADAKTVMARLGHSTIRMVMETYGQMFEGTDIELAKRLDAMAREPKEVSEQLRPASD